MAQPDPKVLMELRTLLSERLAIEVTSDTEDLIDSGTLDSLAFVELLVAIEETWGIVVDLETLDLDDVRTLTSIATFIERGVEERAALNRNAS